VNTNIFRVSLILLIFLLMTPFVVLAQSWSDVYPIYKARINELTAAGYIVNTEIVSIGDSEYELRLYKTYNSENCDLGHTLLFTFTCDRVSGWVHDCSLHGGPFCQIVVDYYSDGTYSVENACPWPDDGYSHFHTNKTIERISQQIYPDPDSVIVPDLQQDCPFFSTRVFLLSFYESEEAYNCANGVTLLDSTYRYDLSVYTDANNGPSSGGPDVGSPGTGGGFPGGRPGKGCGTELPDSRGNPINVATGNMYHQETDFAYSDFLKMERWYNSSAAGSGEFGWQWTYTYGTKLTVEAAQNRIRIVSPTGRARYFTNYSGSYYPYAGTQGDLVATGGGYTETLYDGITNQFDSNGKLIRVENSSGNYITIQYNQLDESSQPRNTVVTDEYGRTVILHHDANGRIDWAKDPAGRQYDYTYTSGGAGDGNLLSVTYPDGTAHNYYYEDSNFPHKLTAIKTAGRTLAAWQYEDTAGTHNGWAKYSSDGQVDGQDVNYVSLAFNNSTTVVTNARQKSTTYVSANINGIYKTTGLTGDCGCSKGRTGYDVYGNLAWRDDATGNRKVYSGYDARGNPDTVMDSYSTVYQRTSYYTYHPVTGAVTSVKRASVFNGYTSSERTYAYNGSNRLTGTHVSGFSKHTDSDTPYYCNYSTSYKYNSHGQMTASTDALGHTVSFGHYSTAWGNPNHGRPSSVTNALTQTVSFGNYSSGKAGWSRDANGILTQNVYDARGRLRAVTVHQRTTGYGYDAFGNMTSMRLPSGKRIGYEYDGANRLTKVRDGLGNYIAYGYDSESNRISEEIHDASGTLLKYRGMDYDADNRLWHTFNSYSSTESGYDNNGNLTSMRDMNGNTTSYRYDPLDRMKAVTQPAPGPGFGNISTTYTYDINDNVTSVTDGRGHITSYVYDDFSRLVEVVSPDTGTTRYEYDAAGNMTKKKDAAGTVVNYSYDELNRLTSIDYPGTDEDITYTYDETASGNYNIGRMTSMSDASGTTSYYYDEYGEMVKEVKTFTGLAGPFTTEYTYDADGNLETMTYPDGRVVTYVYDGAGRVEKVEGDKDGTHKVFASGVEHKPFGGIGNFTFGNGLTAQRTYDQDYRLSYLKSGPMLKRNYGYDNTGNITGISDLVNPDKSQSFGYDNIYRLTSATGPYGSIGYAYDEVGNRQSKTTGAGTTNYTYNYNGTNNKLASATGVEAATYGYDSNGNMTSDGARTYAYNLNNRLISATEGGQTVGEYVYDGLGRRVKKTAGGETTYFIYDTAGRLIAEHDGSGTWQNSRVYLDGEPLARLDAGQQNPGGPAASPDGDSVCLTWEQVAGADSYIACRGTSPSAYFDCSTTITATSYCFGNITGTSLQYFHITAYDSGGNAIGEAFVDGVTLAPPSPELPHYAYNTVLGGQADCAVCHLEPGTFAQGFGVRTSIGLCTSCHNASGVGHAKGYTGGHPVYVNVTADLTHRLPSFGSTTGMGSDSVGGHLLYGSQVVCMSCHNSMQKPNDPGRTWEFTDYTGGVTYTLQHGGWSYYSYLKPVVYRTGSAMSTPADVQDRKTYEVPESEYDIYPASGEVVFHQAQAAGTYIYVTLGNDYLRTANAGNALCLDCHTLSSHKGVNCAICHGTHGTGNLYDVRGRLGTPGGYADVAFTSMTAMVGTHGVCTVCHTTTMYHNTTSLAPLPHYDNQVCVDCHPHDRGFPSFTSVWNPVRRWFVGLGLFDTGTAYAKPPAWVTDGALPPGLQNHSLPPQAWANGLRKFKVSFEIVRQATAQTQSGQSAIKDDIIYYYHNDHLGTPCFLTDEVGAIVWRREQTPFGETSFERGTTTENLRFPGQYWDEEKQSSYNFYRDSYTPRLGRFGQADPIGQDGGINPYAYVNNDSINWFDFWGLFTLGKPPVYEPNEWNDRGKYQLSNNCYSYAWNRPYGHPDYSKPQPGEATGQRFKHLTCEEVKAAAIRDGFKDPKSGCCPNGYHKVQLVIAPGVDYHWYRQDVGGRWSHKPGWGQATNVDASGKSISNPSSANRNYEPNGPNYTEDCGTLCAPN
jgi:RHS repeat-associated protein